MEKIGRKIEIFVIVVIIALIGIIYAFKAPIRTTSLISGQDQSDQQSPNTATSVKPSDNTEAPSPVPSTTIEYQGVDGKNALDLLKIDHQVEVQHYSFGDMVLSIDNIKPDSKHFWAMYVNDSFSQVGASAYVTKSTDKIKWEVDALVDTTK